MALRFRLSKPFRFLAGAAMLGSWGLALGLGMHYMMGWDATPGKAATGSPHVASDSRWRLVMVANPECPCTRASLEVLDRLVRQQRGAFLAEVIFTGLQSTDITARAERIPGLLVRRVEEKAAIKETGAHTSGQIFFFDPRGKVRFSGGLTDGRGASSASAGEAAINTILAGRVAPATLPTYGCALETPPESLENNA